MEPTPPEQERPASGRSRSRPNSAGSAASVAQSVAQSVAVSAKGELPQLHEVVFEYEVFNGRRIKRRVNKPIRLDSPRLVRIFSAQQPAHLLSRSAQPIPR
eukprot:COSAG03_NODE_90_length_13417_cov_11.032512_5_plen_101_part_00